jgi:hypothetical protein
MKVFVVHEESDKRLATFIKPLRSFDVAMRLAA